jgi:hypothetical protein
MKNVRLLEERVSCAVRRLRQLAEEKKGLEAELEELRRELAVRPSDASTEEGWKAERVDIARSIEETLAELRAE